MGELQAGASATLRTKVGEADLASNVGLEASDRFPPVLASARMIALMEVAAARVMQPLLQPGQLSVGVAFSIAHEAPTALGAQVEATARYVRSEGPIFVFEVEASDEGGVIGRGEHRRAIAPMDRLLAKAEKRRAA